MATDKYRIPTEEEERIIRRNGIDPDAVSVTHREDRSIWLIYHKTRDEIVIRQGERPWSRG
jgi:hypothetical protein